MDPNPIRVTTIVASRRKGRLAPAVAGWFAGQIDQRDDFVNDTVDLADTPLPDSLDEEAPEVVALRPRLAEADAFVLVVPEYNRGIPGPLKTVIDCFNAEWEAKPVGFVTYGLSLAGGVRAVEHLRQVFAEFHAVGTKDIVAFPRVLEHFDDDGGFATRTDGSAAAAKLMLDQLRWWAYALRQARADRPFGT